jgi:hypothetical protein
MSTFGYDRGAGVSLSQAKSLASYDGGKFSSFFIRYLADASSWKYFSYNEVHNLLEAGYMVGSVFQEGKDGPKGGYYAGILAAKKAKAIAESLGQPKQSAIFFTVDYDAPESDYNAFNSFLVGVKDVFAGDFFAGIYGKYDVIEAMAARNACTYFWQTLAWSRGLLSDHADLYQYKIDIDANGINVDFNECFNTDIFWGQYQPAVAEPVQEQPVVEPEPPKVETLEMYDDVPVTHWAADAIKKAFDKDVMVGISDRKFGLTQEVTREQLAVALDKLGLLDKPEIVAGYSYEDVPETHWAYNSIKKAHLTDVMDGVADNKFGLGETLTREQFTKVLDTLNLTTVGETYWKVPDIYTDVPSDHWAVDSIKDAYLKGVIIGLAEHKFGLGEAVMREQLAKVFDNLKLLD